MEGCPDCSRNNNVAGAGAAAFGAGILALACGAPFWLQLVAMAAGAWVGLRAGEKATA